LGFVIKCREGLVLAAERRVKFLSKDGDGNMQYQRLLTMRQKSFLLTSPHNFIVVVAYRQAAIGLRIVYSYLAEYIKSTKDATHKQKEVGITMDRRELRLWNRHIDESGVEGDQLCCGRGIRNICFLRNWVKRLPLHSVNCSGYHLFTAT